MPVLVVAVGDYCAVLCLPFDFRFYLLDNTENVFSRTCVLPNIECIFSAKSRDAGTGMHYGGTARLPFERGGNGGITALA